MRRSWSRRGARWNAISNCWRRRRWIWSATSRHGRATAFPRQTLEDQEKLVLQYKGTVKYDEGVVHYNEVQVGYCHITSPISGRVGLRLVDPGNLVTANGTTALAVVTQIQPITVVFTVAEDHLNEVLDQMRHGTKLPVEAWDRDKHTRLATGQLVTVDNQIDTTTGTVKLRATFDNRDNALFPNQFVNTRSASSRHCRTRFLFLRRQCSTTERRRLFT